jgi:uncharacterized membrane protein YdcZ (DUF606 family)
VIAAVAKGGFGRSPRRARLTWYYLTGRHLGAIYVTTVLGHRPLARRGTVVAATIAGQLSASLVVRPAGIPRRRRRTRSRSPRSVGVLLLAAAMYLIVRE